MSPAQTDSELPPRIAGLLRPEAYPHPAIPLSLSETHISWVFRAGNFAYKIKKPVSLGFLDFSSLERRRFYCEEELRINRRTAPDLYLAVMPVTGTGGCPRLGGSGPVLDYAVVMQAFDDNLLFDRLAQSRRLRPEHLDLLASSLAAFHNRISCATPEDRHGLPDSQWAAAAANFTLIRPQLAGSAEREHLEDLRAWTESEFRRHRELMLGRKQSGQVRECHGDLHLGNVVLLDGRPTLFDAIEFDESLRWIDVLSETAFLTMDLAVQAGTALAWRFLDRYLEWTGDYAGLPLLAWFTAYRALVRAKIMFLTEAIARDPLIREKHAEAARRYLRYAEEQSRPKAPCLIVTHGFSGSGKSRLSARLLEELPAIRLRSDVERKRLAGMPARPDLGKAAPDSLYSQAMTARTYRHLARTVDILLGAGLSVIVDATFLRREFRSEQWRLAMGHGARFLILDCRAPLERLQERLKQRASLGGDPSDADVAVLERQRVEGEPLAPDERAVTLGYDTDAGLIDGPTPPTDLAARVARILHEVV